MAHFQLPDGTRFWDRDHKHEKIAIHLGNEIELEQFSETSASGKMPRLQLDKEGVVELRLINRPSSDKPATIAKRKFGLKAVGEGVAVLNGKDEDNKIVTSPLTVVAGAFKNHKGMAKDLLAEVGRSADPLRLYGLLRLLHNDYSNIFNQFDDTDPKKRRDPLACGKVAKAGGDAMIGKVVSHSYNPASSYHKPLRKVTSRDDIDYDPELMRRVRRIIAGHVKGGHPVLVGCTYDPKTSMLENGQLKATRDGGHSVLIVGCNEAGNEFLYVDPFAGGSNMKYLGGIAADSYPSQCFYMGVFKVDSWEDVVGRGPVLRKDKDNNVQGHWDGERYLEVISGPKA